VGGTRPEVAVIAAGLAREASSWLSEFGDCPGRLASVSWNDAELNPPAAAGVAWAAAAGPPDIARTIDSGSQSPLGWSAPTSASRPPAVGRCSGFLARHRSTSGRTSGGTCSRWGSPCTMRYSMAAVVPAPNGPWPAAA
jgi:hypothetical protein